MAGTRWLASFVLLGASSALATQPILSDARFATNHFQFGLIGEAGQAYIIQASRDLTNWSGVLTNVLEGNVNAFRFPATNTSGYFRAKVATPLFGYGVFAKTAFIPGEFSVMSDSYDSADPRFSTAGQYDPLKRRDRGDIASYAGLTNVGFSSVAGKLWTGPEAGVLLSPATSVGSGAWLDSGQTGIQPGYWQTNLQLSVPDIPRPYLPYFVPIGGIVDGESYTYILSTGGWALPSLRNGKTLVTGNAVLFVHDPGIWLSNSTAVIRLSSPNSTLTVYVRGSVYLGGKGVEGAVSPNQFKLFGSPSCQSVEVRVPNFSGAIYAPGATCTLTNGSFTGACVANRVVLEGAVTFHFDENLKRIGGFY